MFIDIIWNRMDWDRVGFAREDRCASLLAFNSAPWGVGLKHVCICAVILDPTVRYTPPFPRLGASRSTALGYARLLIWRAESDIYSGRGVGWGRFVGGDSPYEAAGLEDRASSPHRSVLAERCSAPSRGVGWQRLRPVVGTVWIGGGRGSTRCEHGCELLRGGGCWAC